MPISHRVRQLHPELFTEAIVLHARQGDRGLSLADSGGLDIEGERGRCHIDAAATTSLALRAAAARHSGCVGRRNCNVNLDDLDQDRPDLNCEPLQAPGMLPVTEDDDDGVIGVDEDLDVRTAPLGVMSGAVVGVVTGCPSC
jgi:hypothetical protein